MNVPGHPLIVGGVADCCAVVSDEQLRTQISHVADPVGDWMHGQIHAFETQSERNAIHAASFVVARCRRRVRRSVVNQRRGCGMIPFVDNARTVASAYALVFAWLMARTWKVLLLVGAV